MQSIVSDFRAFFEVYRNHRARLNQFTKRFLSASFRSSSLGWLWLLLQPLVMMIAYTLVFGYIFTGRYGRGPAETNWDYAIGVYLSLTVFGFATDIIGGAPLLFETQRSLLTNTRIPAEVFVIAFLQAAFVRFCVALVPCLILAKILSTVYWSAIWIIPLFAGYAIFLLGLAFVLAVVGMRIPDVRQLIGLTATVLMFSSAVFYPVERVPVWLQSVNPILQAVALTRDFVLWGIQVRQCIFGLVVEWTGALVSLAVGLWLLRRNRAYLLD